MAKNNNSIGIIPARYASTRFPGKPLVKINGKTMVQRVFEQASKSRLDMVVVATDDQRIYDHVESFNGRVVMTDAFHKTGTDRCSEVIRKPAYSSFDLVVNIQGDEPFIHPDQINLALDSLSANANFDIVTLVKRIEGKEELFDPNCVKVVFNKDQKALYFSRLPIPYSRNEREETWLDNKAYFKHIGLYAFRRKTLLELAGLPMGSLEATESLEQLRWLENGYDIGVNFTPFETFGIDTPEDLKRVTG